MSSPRPLLSLIFLLSFVCPAARGDEASAAAALTAQARAKIAAMQPLFDGKALNGWVQAPPFPTTLSGDDLGELLPLVAKLKSFSDPLTAHLRAGFDEQVKSALRSFSDESRDARALKSALARELNKAIAGPSLARYLGSMKVSPATEALLARSPEGEELARLNRLILEEALDLPRSPEASWAVKDGAMSSLGAGRGVIYTERQFTKYRLIFTMRHLGGPPADHAPCVLIFGMAPKNGDKAMDALGAIQFQPPNGGSWDYRPGRNNSGKEFFTRLAQPRFNSKEWHQVEMVVNAETGEARMAVAQPPGTKAIEVLRFKDPAAGKAGPIAWQMHNRGLFDEYKDVRIETNPSDDRLLTVE